MEDIPEAEVLSLGRALEIVKDLGDAETVHDQYGLSEFTGTHAIGDVRTGDGVVGSRSPAPNLYLELTVLRRWRSPRWAADGTPSMWRRRFQRRRASVQAEGATEIIAVSVAEDTTSKGASLKEAMVTLPGRARRRVHVDCRYERTCLGVAKDGLSANQLFVYEDRRLVAVCVRGDRHRRHLSTMQIPMNEPYAASGLGMVAAGERARSGQCVARGFVQLFPPRQPNIFEIDGEARALRREGADESAD